MIKPHGGKLINRIIDISKWEEFIEISKNSESIYLNNVEISDLYMIAVGAFSPLTGFMCKKEYISACEDMHLLSGLPWTIPITLSVDRDKSEKIKEGNYVSLRKENGKLRAVMLVKEKFNYNREFEAQKIYKTTDTAHPGVARLYKKGDILIGGEIFYSPDKEKFPFKKYFQSPAEIRLIFKNKGWKSIVAFQTRNPIHRAHEYLHKCILETMDGLLIHPLIGETKNDDIPADVRMKCYEILIRNYYPKNRVMLSVFPAVMRYAGPKEAIFHSIVRKNYGCTHFIVGRDHAGIGKYYGTYEAQKIFSEFDLKQIGIIPIFFDNVFYCKKCKQMATVKTCPHENDSQIFFSGTKVREILTRGEHLPEEFTRKEIGEILLEYYENKN